jgi:enamine deaminase RidA (YjgF/YER057c/UK114 family)
MTITRIETSPRMSQAVVHNGLVYLAGQVAYDAPGASAAEQTRDILQRVDNLLSRCGTDKTHLLSATIWLADIGDYAAINEVWDAWVAPGTGPARACVESRLAAPQFTVEIAVIAASTRP